MNRATLIQSPGTFLDATGLGGTRGQRKPLRHEFISNRGARDWRALPRLPLRRREPGGVLSATSTASVQLPENREQRGGGRLGYGQPRSARKGGVRGRKSHCGVCPSLSRFSEVKWRWWTSEGSVKANLVALNPAFDFGHKDAAIRKWGG
jgi:hypothetical protein